MKILQYSDSTVRADWFWGNMAKFLTIPSWHKP